MRTNTASLPHRTNRLVNRSDMLPLVSTLQHSSIEISLSARWEFLIQDDKLKHIGH